MDPILFMGIENVDDISGSEDEPQPAVSTCTKNPNREDSRRLFEKAEKITFFHQKRLKITSQNCQNWPRISFFDVIYQPFELEIHKKSGILSLKIMP